MSSSPSPSRRFALCSQVTGAETVIACSGRLTSECAEEFKEEVRRLIPAARCLVLDFTHVEYLDSSGIGAVVRLYVTARNAKCELRLVNFNQRVRDLLGLTGLIRIFGDCGKNMVRMP